MADYKEIVNEVIDRAGTIAEETGVKEVYANGLSRAKSYAKIAKLTVGVNRDNEELGRVFTEIGKLFYEQSGGKGEGFYSSLFAKVEELRESIAEKEKEIDSVKDEIAERSRVSAAAKENTAPSDTPADAEE